MSLYDERIELDSKTSVITDPLIEGLERDAETLKGNFQASLDSIKEVQEGQRHTLVQVTTTGTVICSGSQNSARWKPREEHKPGNLHLSDRPTALDTWISKLKSYAHGIDEQPYNDAFNIVEGIMADEVKTAVKFTSKNKIAILGENSLVTKLEAHWKTLYPRNRLRISLFETKSGEGERWDSWEARMVEEAAKAELSEMTGEEVMALLIVMNYKGPFAGKIRSELAKASRLKSDSPEISLDAARDIYAAEEYASRMGDANSVRQISQQQGVKLNNRGKYNSSSNSGNINQGQSQPATSGKPKFDFKNHPHAKQMAAQKRCFLCYKVGCPSTTGNKAPCPSRNNIMCSFCQQKGNRAKGHVAEACTKKWDSENRTMGSSIRELFNTEDPDQTQ